MKSASLQNRLAGAVAFALFTAVVVTGMTLPTQGQTVTTLFNFTGSQNASTPVGVMAQGRDGNYYGITQSPGAGTIYKIDASGNFTLLHTMASDSSEGASCNGLVLGTDGNFYGTCYRGGNSGIYGTIFKVTPAGTLTLLHAFNPAVVTTEGCLPLGVPFQASDGNFYGTTQECGSNGLGNAYKITPAGVFTTINQFSPSANIGYTLTSTLIQGSDGNLWGTANFGGVNGGGTVFKMSLSGTVTAVYSFTSGIFSTTGSTPYAGLVLGNDGNYYGTTQQGGPNGQGVVFKVTPGGVATVLHNFNITADNGGVPQLPMTLGTDGNFYGVATDCFAGGCSPADIFKITSAGVFTDVYNFTDFGGNDNSEPFMPLLLATTGTFYGTTATAGSSDSGSFYSLAEGQTAFAAILGKSAKVGAMVGILGQGFSSSSVVKFGGVKATKVTPSGSTYLTATVPTGALTGTVSVTTGTTTLNGLGTFKITPTIKTFLPTSGSVGTMVTITGTGLTQATKVTFNNVSASFTVNSDTQITATVPTGATSGKIAVVTKGGSATSSTIFTVN